MLVHFEQVLYDLKGFRTILVKKLFRLKMFTLLETKRFSVLFAVFSTFLHFEAVFNTLRFLKFLTAFRFCAFWPFWLCHQFLNDYF